MTRKSTDQSVECGDDNGLLLVVALVEGDLLAVGDEAGVHVAVLPLQLLLLHRHAPDRPPQSEKQRRSYYVANFP